MAFLPDRAQVVGGSQLAQSQLAFANAFVSQLEFQTNLFWVGQVNRYPLRNGDAQHAMVCSFITSAEYQLRLGSLVSHTNRECPQLTALRPENDFSNINSGVGEALDCSTKTAVSLGFDSRTGRHPHLNRSKSTVASFSRRRQVRQTNS